MEDLGSGREGLAQVSGHRGQSQACVFCMAWWSRELGTITTATFWGDWG